MTDAENDPMDIGSMPISSADAIIEAMRELHGATMIHIDGLDEEAQIAVVPKGMQVVDLKPYFDKFRTRPERLEQIVALTTADSVVDYVNRYKTDKALGFFDAGQTMALTVAFDYHGAPITDGKITLEADPAWVKHLAAYAFPLSDELRAWINKIAEAKAKGGMSSTDFAEFLLDREFDIENPPVNWMAVDQETTAAVLEALNLHNDKAPIDAAGNYLPPETIPDDGPADDGEDPDDRYVPRSALQKLRQIRFGGAAGIVNLARNVEVSSQSKAEAKYDPKSGAKSISFSEENETQRNGRKVKVPDAFFLYIPVFRGGPRRLIPVRIAYRVRGGAIVWALEICDQPRMIERAVVAAAQRIETETGVKMLRGMPRGGDFADAIAAARHLR